MTRLRRLRYDGDFDTGTEAATMGTEKRYCAVGPADRVLEHLLGATRELLSRESGLALYVNLDLYADLDREDAYRALCADLTAHLRLPPEELDSLPWITVNPRHLTYRVMVAHVLAGRGPRALLCYVSRTDDRWVRDMVAMVKDWGDYASEDGGPWRDRKSVV